MMIESGRYNLISDSAEIILSIVEQEFIAIKMIMNSNIVTIQYEIRIENFCILQPFKYSS